jgi:hypothetical protein
LTHIKIPAYAKHRNVTPEYIRVLIKKGKIPGSALKRVGKRFHVDPKKADAALDANLSHINRSCKNAAKNKTTKRKFVSSKKSKTRKIKPLTNLEKKEMTLAECQRLHERYKAALKQLEYDQKSGRLVPADEVKAAAFEIGRSIRDQIMNIPHRLGPVLAGERDPNRITQLLQGEFRKALEQLTDER